MSIERSESKRQRVTTEPESSNESNEVGRWFERELFEYKFVKRSFWWRVLEEEKQRE